MQTLNDGRDQIARTHVINVKDKGELKLHKLRNGAYQLGEGRGSRIVTSMEDIALFIEHQALSEAILQDIEQSFARNAPAVARQEKTLQDIEAAAATRPGTIDQMAKALENVAPGVVANITKVLMDALVQHGVIPHQTDEHHAAATPFIPAENYVPSQTDAMSAGHMSPEAEYKHLLKSGLKINPKRQVFDPERVAGVDPSKWQDAPPSADGFEPPVETQELVGVASAEAEPPKGLKKHKGGRG